MPWNAGHYQVSHPREPWTNNRGEGRVLVNCRWLQLKGTDASYGNQTATYNAAYKAAKTKFDLPVAFEIVERCISDNVLDELADIIYYSDKSPILVFPHMSFDDDDGVDGAGPPTDRPSNALPFAFAQYLSMRLGCPVNETIFQCARIGRTKLTKWKRFLHQPSFEGEVVAGQPYVLLDDVFTTGGTLACLRSYIVRNRGIVVGVATLAHESGRHQIFPIVEQTRVVLKDTYGNELEAFWKDTLGHDLSNLTEAEARFLIEAAPELGSGRGHPLLQCLRERIDQTAAT
jgi:hypothetical protein